MTDVKDRVEGKQSPQSALAVAVLERPAPMTGSAKPRKERLERIRRRTVADPIWQND